MSTFRQHSLSGALLSALCFRTYRWLVRASRLPVYRLTRYPSCICWFHHCSTGGVYACFFQACFIFLFFWGIPKKLTISPHTAVRLCALSIFFSAGTMNYKYITETFFQWTVCTRNQLVVIKQSEGCKFMPKMHQNMFGGRTPSGPVYGAYALS